MRPQFLAGQAPLRLAGKTWNPDLKALSPDTTPAQVALIDQPFAAALTKLDDQLLNFGATGTAGAAIAAFVRADENLIDDVLARAAQSSSTLGTWKEALTQDTRARQNAAAALQKALGYRPRPEPINAHPRKGARTGHVQSAAANQDMHRPAVYRSAPAGAGRHH